MRFVEIESLLGPEAVSRVQQSVTSAYQAAGAHHEGFKALREFLVGMLAAVVTTERHLPVAEQLAAADAAQLNALVRKIREISDRAGPAVAKPVPNGVVLEMRKFQSRRDRREGTAQPTAASGHAAQPTPSARLAQTMTSARRSRDANTAAECWSQITRMRRLTAETMLVVAESKALVAASRSLPPAPRAVMT